MNLQCIQSINDSKIQDGNGQTWCSYLHLGSMHIQAAREVKSWDWRNSSIKIFYNDEIMNFRGEEPRFIVFSGKAYIYSYIAIGPKMWKPFLVDLDHKQFLSIDIEDRTPSKNYSFFEFDDQLFLIYQFDPLEIFVLSEWGLDYAKFSPWHLETAMRFGTSGDAFSIYRGGTSGLNFSGTIKGFGHTNTLVAKPSRQSESIMHRPFFWDLEMSSRQLTIHDVGVPEDTLLICDPTSFNKIGADFYLQVSEASRHHFYREPHIDRSRLFRVLI